MEYQNNSDIINSLPWAVIRLNSDLNVLFANAAARKILTWKVEDGPVFLYDFSWTNSMGEPLLPENHPVTQCFLTGEKISGMSLGISFSPENRMIRIESDVVPEFDEGSERPCCVVFTFRESFDHYTGVSENSYRSLSGQKTLHDLEISEKRFRNLFENMEQGFCIIERIPSTVNQPVDFRYLSVNPAFERHTGMRNVVGKTIRELVPAGEQAIFDKYNDVVETGIPHRFESYISSLDIWIDAEIIPTAKPNQIAVLFSNTSERKRLEESLGRRKQLLKDMGKIAKVGGWELDCSTMKQDWTEETYAIHDREPGIYDPDSSEELSRFEPGSKELIKKAFEAAFKNGDPYDLELEMTTIKGNRKWVRAVCQPLLKDGKVTKLTGTLQDITDRVKVEENLTRLAERHNLAIHSSGIGIWDWDILKNELIWDEQMVALYGLQPGNFKGAYEAWLNGVHPDDREESDKISQSAVRGEREYDTEFRVLWPDGSVHWLKADGRVFRDENGTATRMVGVNYDITERKESENKLREQRALLKQVLDSEPDAIFAIDLNYYLLVNNRRHQQVLVDTGGHQLQPGESILPSDYQPEIIDYWRGLYNRALDGEEFKTEMEWPYSDGQMHSIETNLSPLRNSDSKIVGALAVIRDTTEHKISDKKRKESEERYQKLAENFPDTTIAFYNNELKVTFVTGQELIKSGKTASDYIGKRFDEILIPSLATVAEKSFKKAFKGEIDTFEGKSFDERFIRVIAVPIVESDGTVNEIQVISQNITERKKAEYNRLISERKYSLLFDKSGTPTIVFKFPGGIISEANEKVEELTGYSRDEMIGKTSVEVGFVENENRAKVLALLMHNEPVFGFELPILAKNGENKAVLVNAVHFYNEEIHYIISTWLDITDRKRADQKLLESEERTKAMLRAIPDMLFRVDRNGTFLDYKADVKDLYAQSVSLIGLRNRDVTPPEFADLIERKIEETLSSGQIQTFEYQMLIPGTGLQEFEARMAPSGPDEVISIVRNITEQKKAERQLRESEQRFATIFKDSPVAIAISRVSDGKIIHINSSFTNLLGLTPEEVLGKTTLELGIWAIPADRLRFIEILSKNQQVVGMETLLGLKSGENRQVQVWGDLINLNGEPCMLAEVIDITDKKNQEQEIRSQNEKLHAILNSLPDKLFIHDSDGYFLEAYTTDPEGFIIPVENILGSTLFDIFPKDVAELNLKYLKECITNKELITHEFSTDYKGKFMHFEVRVVPFMDDKVIRFVRDITQKKEIEKEILELNANLERKVEERTLQLTQSNDELVKAKEVAEQANKSKSIFLANMSHEIRTPLNSIIVFSELLYNSLNNDKKRSQVESIRKSGLSLLNIINDILDLSKVEAGKIVIDNEPLNVFKIVGDVGRMFEIKVAEKKLDLIIELETNLSRPLLLDETRLRQILFNLIGNAVKFTSEGGVTVFIHHQEKDKEHVDLQIRITDTGIGIPEDQLKLIFEPFVQQQGQTQKSFGGTGLGLAISQRMAEAMGGEIRINSKVNVGSEFILSLKNVAYATSYSEEEEAGPAAYANIRFDGRTILIVDDVADNRDLLLDVLEMTGARLLEAQNGAEAVRIATAELPDIILMDIRMPVMDGLEACKALKQSPATAGIQCIAVSASIKLGQSQNEVPENFEDSLMKPLAFDQLFEVLKKYLGHAFKSDSAITNAPNTTVVQEEEWSDDLQQYIVEKVMPLYEHIMRTQLVDEMEEFGKLLVYAGDRYNDNILMTTGRKIKDYTDLFDVEKLTKTMHEFQFVLNRKLK